MQIASVVFNCFTNDSRVEKQANSLGEAGYKVTVFALWKSDLPVTQRQKNFLINRVPLILRDYYDQVPGFFKFIELVVKFALKVRNFDVVHCHDCTPLLSGMLAKIISLGRLKIVYDAHELQTEVQNLDRSRKFTFFLTEFVARVFINNFITVGQSIAYHYFHKYKYPLATILYNSPKCQSTEKKNIIRNKLGIFDEKRIFLFQGSIVPNRGIEDVLDAFLEIENFHLVVLGFSGNGNESRLLFARLTELSKSKENIHYLPAVESKDLLDYTSSADFGLCLTRDTCLNHKYSLPNKFFEYLSVRIPVMVSNLPEMSRIVRRYGCGTVCNELNKSSISDAITEISHMNYTKLCNGASRVAFNYDWEKQEKKLLNLYSKL